MISVLLIAMLAGGLIPVVQAGDVETAEKRYVGSGPVVNCATTSLTGQAPGLGGACFELPDELGTSSSTVPVTIDDAAPWPVAGTVTFLEADGLSVTGQATFCEQATFQVPPGSASYTVRVHGASLDPVEGCSVDGVQGPGTMGTITGPSAG